MKKIIKFLQVVLIFAPILIVFIYPNMILNLVVAAFNPKETFDIVVLKKYDVEKLPQNDNNPFADFELPQATQSPQEIIDYTYDERYPITELFFTSSENDIVYKYNNAYLKNLTSLSKQEVTSLMTQPINFSIEKNSSEPQILIMHTHATESFQPESKKSYDPEYSFRNTDNTQNIVAVGKVMTDTLNSMGYNTIQDDTQHDYPDYNGSYDRSEVTVRKYLEQYPSIKVVLDIHRDAVARDNQVISAVTSINNEKYAQVMIISGADNGYLNMPNYKENLKFATGLQNNISRLYNGLTRPILFDYRHYNQDLTTGSLLIEVGSHGNTLTQAKNSGRAVALSIANYFDNTQ